MMYRSNLDWECDFMVKNKYLGQSLFQRGGYEVRLSLSLGG